MKTFLKLLFVSICFISCKEKEPIKIEKKAPVVKVINEVDFSKMVKFNGANITIGTNDIVEVAPFYLDKYLVTVKNFRRFIEATNYITDAENFGDSAVYNFNTLGWSLVKGAYWEYPFGENTPKAIDNHPVTHISWNDANAYVNWLSDTTERNYRLPSESEMEYAIRGGTETNYWWGNDAPSNDKVENVTGFNDVSSTRRRWNDGFRGYGDGYWGPAPVAEMSANRFGLFDINGNLKEWTADCWHSNYNRAPTDGSAWVNPGCETRVVRGADWSSTPELSYSAIRISSRASSRGARVGIRIARDL